MKDRFPRNIWIEDLHEPDGKPEIHSDPLACEPDTILAEYRYVQAVRVKSVTTKSLEDAPPNVYEVVEAENA